MPSTRNNRNPSSDSLPFLDPIPSVSSNMSLPSLHIHTFDGESDDAAYFISQIKEVAALGGWSDKYTLAYTKTKLTGKAHKLIKQHQAIKNIDTPEELFKILTEFFGSQQDLFAPAMLELNQLQMIPGESFKNLAYRISLLVAKVHDDVNDQNTLNKLKFMKFIEILPPDIRLHVLQQNIKDFDAAVKTATTFSACQLNNLMLSNISSSTADTQNETVNALQKQLNTLSENVNKLTQSTLPNPNSNTPALSCNENSANSNSLVNKSPQNSRPNHRMKLYKQPGHRLEQNRKSVNKIQHNFKQNSYFQSNRRGKPYYRDNIKQIRCQLCNRMGHSAKACWSSKKKHNNQSTSSSNDVNAIPSTSFASLQCQICQNFGHLALSCPQFQNIFRLNSTGLNQNMNNQTDNVNRCNMLVPMQNSNSMNPSLLPLPSSSTQDSSANLNARWK